MRVFRVRQARLTMAAGIVFGVVVAALVLSLFVKVPLLLFAVMLVLALVVVALSWRH